MGERIFPGLGCHGLKVVDQQQSTPIFGLFFAKPINNKWCKGNKEKVQWPDAQATADIKFGYINFAKFLFLHYQQDCKEITAYKKENIHAHGHVFYQPVEMTAKSRKSLEIARR
jgi:hypothetical protein